MIMNQRLTLSLSMCALAVGLTACVVTPARVSFTPPGVALIAPMAPPPPQMEMVPANPGPGYFWVAGFWHWDGHQHRWEGGHWERHREHQQWVPHRWVQDGHGQWAMHEGHWRPD